MPLTRQHIEHPIGQTLGWLGVAFFAIFMMDFWGVILHLLIGTPWPNYVLLGRYILTMIQTGHLVIHHIASYPALPHENLIGWLMHIAVGLVDTCIYMTIIFKVLHTTPHLLTSLLIGWSLIIMPILIEQPMLGMGVAARLTPHPDTARLITFSYHTVFGLCLFLGSVIFHRIFVLMTHLKKKG